MLITIQFLRATETVGCDFLTCSPELLEELSSRSGPVPPRLAQASAPEAGRDRLHLDERDFRWMFNEDPMAVEKLAVFHADARKLEEHAGFNVSNTEAWRTP